jgi:hypothetical protein
LLRLKNRRKRPVSRLNAYSGLGLSLLVAGAVVILSSMFIFSLPWLTGLAIALFIMAFVLLVLARTIPRISPEVSSLLLASGRENISRVLEEIGLHTRAVYLPSTMTGGHARALIPLHENTVLPRGGRPLPERFIVTYGPGSEDMGILVSTVGTAAVELLEARPGPETASLEAALTYILLGQLGVAGGATVMSQNGRTSVAIHNLRWFNARLWSDDCFGSPVASIAAAVAAEAWDKPVVIASEVMSGKKLHIELEAVGESL